MMPKPEPLKLYLDLRRRLLAREFEPAERFFAQTVADAFGYTKSATLGVLNALTTDGYLNKHTKTFSPVILMPQIVGEWAERLAAFTSVSAIRIARYDAAKLEKLKVIVERIGELERGDEAYFLGLMECFRLLLRSGEYKALSEMAHRVIPQAFYRVIWNLLIPSGTEPFVGPAMATYFERATVGDIDGVEVALNGLWASLRGALEARAAVNPMLQLDKEFVMQSNAIREHDVRGRMLTLTHPAYGSYLPIVDGAGPGRCLKVLEA